MDSQNNNDGTVSTQYQNQWEQIFNAFDNKRDRYLNDRNTYDITTNASDVNLNAIVLRVFDSPPKSDSGFNPTPISAYILPIEYQSIDGTRTKNWKVEVPIKMSYEHSQMWVTSPAQVQSSTTKNVTLVEKFLVGEGPESISCVNFTRDQISCGDIIKLSSVTARRYWPKPKQDDDEKKTDDKKKKKNLPEGWRVSLSARTAHKKDGFSCYSIYHIFKNRITDTMPFKKVTDDMEDDFPLQFSFVADPKEIMSKNPAEGGYFISYCKPERFEPSDWGIGQDKTQPPKFMIKSTYIAHQWRSSEEVKDIQSILLKTASFESSLRTLGISNVENLSIIGPDIIEYIDFVFYGNVMIDSTKGMEGVNGQNGEDSSNRRPVDYGISAIPNIVVFDLPKFVCQYGIPVSADWAQKYMDKFSGGKRKDNYDPLCFLLNETSRDVKKITSDPNKSFRVIPIGCQMADGWKEDVAKMTATNGEEFFDKKKSFGRVIFNSKQKPMIYVIDTNQIQAHLNAASSVYEPLYNIIKEKPRPNLTNLLTDGSEFKKSAVQIEEIDEDCKPVKPQNDNTVADSQPNVNPGQGNEPPKKIQKKTSNDIKKQPLKKTHDTN